MAQKTQTAIQRGILATQYHIEAANKHYYWNPDVRDGVVNYLKRVEKDLQSLLPVEREQVETGYSHGYNDRANDTDPRDETYFTSTYQQNA